MVAGRGPSPSLVLSLIQRLPDDSLTAALASGGREHFGWGVAQHALANIYDAINANTIATGKWRKGKAPKLPPYPRPESKKPEEKKRVTVKDLFGILSRR